MNIGVVMYQTSFTKGQELVAQRMARELFKQGHKVYLITGPYHDNKPIPEYNEIERGVEGYLFFQKSEFQVPLIRVNGYVSTWPPRRIMFRNFLDVLRRLSDRFSLDVIISHSTLWNGPEEITKFVSWRRILKHQGLDADIVTHCYMPHYQPPDPVRYDIVERTFRFTWNRMVFPQIHRTANIILCTTPIEKYQMIASGAKAKRCHLYPGGVDEDVFQKYGSEDPEGFLEKHSVPANSKLITYMGTLEERKNPLAVVRISKMLRKLEDVHFVLAGHPSNQHEQVMKEAKGLHNLSYVGAISEKDKVALIRSSYVNILLSRMEALGLTQLEFMYGGVPIVSSAVGGQRWLIRDCVDGIHVRGPDDLKGAAKAVEILVKNPTLRDELALNAKNRAKEFTLPKITSDLSSRLMSLKTSQPFKFPIVFNRKMLKNFKSQEAHAFS
jgi:D-inositol-3-phosphate glycosyltransferase